MDGETVWTRGQPRSEHDKRARQWSILNRPWIERDIRKIVRSGRHGASFYTIETTTRVSVLFSTPALRSVGAAGG